eukprot:g18359.t1
MPDMVQDRTRHLTEDCGFTMEALQLLFETPGEADARRPELPPGQLYARSKRIFYAATRKWFVQAVAKDWARGDPQAEERAADSLTEKYFGSRDQPNETREQLRRLAVTAGAPEPPDEFAKKRYRPSPSGIEEAYYGGECTWCGCRFAPKPAGELWCEPVERTAVPDALGEHLRQCRPVFKPTEEDIQRRREYVGEAKQKDAERGKQVREEIIGRYSCLRDASGEGPMRPGRITHVAKIECRFCRLNLTSSAGAMALHTEAHLRDDYIKNSEICRRVRAEDGTWTKVFTGEFRPEYHQPHVSGHFFAGSDASLCSIAVPRLYGPRFIGARGCPHIKCRFCEKYCLEYDEGGHDLARRGKAVSMMREHEAICSSRPKIVKVPWTPCKRMPPALKAKINKDK